MTESLEYVRPKVLPGELELQLLLGHVIEFIYLKTADDGLDDREVKLVSTAAEAFRQGAAELGDQPRTLAESALALDVVDAVRHALSPSNVEELRGGLNTLAAELEALALNQPVTGASLEVLGAKLLRIHDALAESTALSTDEVIDFDTRASGVQ